MNMIKPEALAKVLAWLIQTNCPQYIDQFLTRLRSNDLLVPGTDTFKLIATRTDLTQRHKIDLWTCLELYDIDLLLDFLPD
jgi:hypothetical protein